MDPGFAIRRLTEDDAEASLALRREALEREPFAFAASPEDDRGLSREAVRASLADRQRTAIFGAFVRSRLVGVVGISRAPQQKHRHKAQAWGMYVTPGHRGCGAGRALLDAAIAWARSLADVEQVQLCVTEPATAARGLYESAGFREFGREERALQHEGRFVAERHLCLELRPAPDGEPEATNRSLDSRQTPERAARAADADASRTVRRLGAHDLPALLALYRDLHPGDDETAPGVDVGALWREILRDPRLAVLGAFAGGELVATATAAVVPNLTRGARPYAVVENVVTRRDARRLGHGAAVMRALLDECWTHGCYKVMLQSAIGRGGAHAFYEAIGFDRTSKQAFIVRR